MLAETPVLVVYSGTDLASVRHRHQGITVITRSPTTAAKKSATAKTGAAKKAAVKKATVETKTPAKTATKTAAKKTVVAKKAVAAKKAPAAKTVAKKTAAPKTAPAKTVAKKTAVTRVTKTQVAAGPVKKKAPAKTAAKKTVAKRSAKELSRLDQQVALIVASLEDDKAENVVVLDLVGRASFADRMIIATGLVDRQLQAMANHVASKLKDAKFGRTSMEGLGTTDWVLMDAGDVVVHLFLADARAQYALEKMWGPDSPTE